MSQLDVSAGYMQPSQDVIREGLTIPESANIKKNLLALLLSLGAKDSMEEDENAEVEYDIDNDTIGKNVDAYQSAQVLEYIVKKSKDVFVQRAIERALKTKGLFDNDDIIMAQEAFVAGFLTVALFKSLTASKLNPDEAETKTIGDIAKAFLLGAGISWIGTKGRYQIKKMEKEEEKAQNEAAANPMGGMEGGGEPGMGGAPQFAEGSSPGKKNINAQAAQKTNQNVQEANSLKQVSPKLDKDETKSGDIAAGEEIEQERMELLTYRDYFAYVNNYLQVQSEPQMIAVTLVRNLMNTNFKDYLAFMGQNVWMDQYGLKSLLHNNNKRKKKQATVLPLDLLESLAYEYIALLTLIAKDLTETYIKKRYKLQKQIMEEQEAMNNAYDQEQMPEEEMAGGAAAGAPAA